MSYLQVVKSSSFSPSLYISYISNVLQKFQETDCREKAGSNIHLSVTVASLPTLQGGALLADGGSGRACRATETSAALPVEVPPPAPPTPRGQCPKVKNRNGKEAAPLEADTHALGNAPRVQGPLLSVHVNLQICMLRNYVAQSALSYVR